MLLYRRKLFDIFDVSMTKTISLGDDLEVKDLRYHNISRGGDLCSKYKGGKKIQFH